MTPNGFTVIRHGKTAPTCRNRPKLVPNDVTAPKCLIYNGKMHRSLFSTSRNTKQTVSERRTRDAFARSTLGGFLTRTNMALVKNDIRRVPLTCGSVREIVQTRRGLMRVRKHFVPHVMEVGGRWLGWGGVLSRGCNHACRFPFSPKAADSSHVGRAC